MKLLEEGDVIFLQDGMEVCAEIPYYIMFSNRRFSEKMGRGEIRIGKIYFPPDSSPLGEAVGKLVKRVSEAFSFEGIEISTDRAEKIVRENIPNIEYANFCFKEGDFVVTRVEQTGDRTGHGPHDIFSGGRKIICKRLKNGEYSPDGQVAEFHQSGDFKTIIRDITPIGKMKLTFI